LINLHQEGGIRSTQQQIRTLETSHYLVADRVKPRELCQDGQSQGFQFYTEAV
jgi:hypothetical protein